MKKLILSLILSSHLGVGGCLFAQSSFTITPNPTPSGVVSDLKIDVQGKILTATQTHYYNASNLDFFSNFTINWNFLTRDDNGTCYFSNVASANESYFMLAPVDIPNGAVITRLKTFYVDNTSAEQLTVELIRRLKTENPQTNDVIATNLSTANVNTSIRTAQATVSTNNVIDNLLYHYFIKVKIGDFSDVPTQQWRGSALAIRDVELQYTY
jgi:hypothetical protein